MFCLNVPGNGESLRQEFGCVSDWSFQKLFEGCVIGVFMIIGLLPLMDCLTVVNEDVEVVIHQQDTVWLNRRGVEKHWLWRAVEGVRV